MKNDADSTLGKLKVLYITVDTFYVATQRSLWNKDMKQLTVKSKDTWMIFWKAELLIYS